MAEDGKNPNTPGMPEEPVKQVDTGFEESLETDSDSRTVLEEIEQPGSLEVEDMPESNELQERRRKVKNRLQELSNIGGEMPSSDEDVFDEEESGLMDLLREANLSPRHLKFCCSGILVVLLLVGFVFGGKAALNWWQERPDEETPVEEPDEPVETPADDDYSFLDPSVLGGILVGEDSGEEDPATGVGEDLGDNSDSGDSFSDQINDFAKIFESLQVDVNELLNQSNNRLSTLRDYEGELNYHLFLAVQNLETLQAESNGLAEKFAAVEEDKERLELNFFERLQDLDAPAVNGALNAFVEAGQDIVRLRAEFNARQKLISYYEQAVVALELRIADIGFNEEALVKGVRVVDLEGSTLDLIIQGEDL
ncbi:MAG: hypothetical protein AAB383_00515 [Patescibacteria group bacterium]